MTKNQIKQIQKLKQKKYRTLERKFLIEGTHLLEECINSKIYSKLIEYIIIKKDFKKDSLLNKLNNYNLEFVDNLTFKKITDTENPEGIAAIIKMPTEKSENLSDSKLIVCLDKINDPGNLGTILRTCWWFGVDVVVISKDSADVYNSKVIRASQGAIFNLPMKLDVDLNSYLDFLSKENYKIYLTTLNTKNYLSKEKFKKDDNYVFVFGNEVKGISENLLKNDKFNRIKIDPFTNCESLNVSISVGIVLSFIKLNFL